MTATIEEPQTARNALLDALTSARSPMQPAELAELTEVNANNVRQILHRLAASGVALRTDRGWSLARPETALAVPAEAPRPAPARPRSTGPAIDGAALLDGVERFVGHFARFPSQAALTATVLWAAHTHVRDEDGRLALAASPRLLLLSSEPGSGKSTVLELINLLAAKTYGLDVEPTEPAFRSMMGDECATALLDEADVLFGAGKRKSAIRAIINASYTRTGAVSFIRGGKINRVRVFGPVALAGLDVIQTATGGMLAAILSRSIVIHMRRPDEDVPDITASAAGAEAGAQGSKLLGLWAQSNREAIVSCEPEIPAGVRLRPAQIWRPLLAVAEVAGGPWPARARAACSELATATPDAPAEETRDLTGGFFSALAALDEE